MLIVLVWIALSGCSSTQYAGIQALHETEEEMPSKDKDTSGPTNFEGIADVLGCMFAPNDCPLKKRQEERKLDR